METNRIIHGDATEVLPELDDGIADLVFSDYPFYVVDEVVEKTSEEFYRILKTGGNCAVINNPNNHFKYIPFFQDFEFRNSVPLIRNHAFYPAWMLGFQHNWLLLLYKEERDKWYGNKENHNQDALTDVWPDIEYNPGHHGDVYHPEAIPEELTQRIIELTTEEGDLVVDPFFGSGTTGVVCKRLGREYIGIELEEEYVEAAQKRIRTDWSEHEDAMDW